MTITVPFQLDDDRIIDITSEAYSATEFEQAMPVDADVTLTWLEQIRADGAIYQALCNRIAAQADLLHDEMRERYDH